MTVRLLLLALAAWFVTAFIAGLVVGVTAEQDKVRAQTCDTCAHVVTSP